MHNKKAGFIPAFFFVGWLGIDLREGEMVREPLSLSLFAFLPFCLFALFV